MYKNFFVKNQMLVFLWRFEYGRRKSAKLRALRAPMPTCLACLRANVPCVPTCARANASCVLTCSRALRAHVPMCLACLRGYMIKCSGLACSRVNVPCVRCVPTRSRAIITNDKYKFSMTCFPYFFVIVLCLFLVK